MNQEIFEKDIAFFKSTFAFSSELEGKTLLVTGSTGLIGRCIVEFLLASVHGITILAPVRNGEKAHRLFGHRANLIITQCDLVEYLSSKDLVFDFAIHCASPTNGSYIASHPAEVFAMMYDSTRNLLDAARACGAQGVVYVSSVEYYGVIKDPVTPIDEASRGYTDFDSMRSAYPLGKQACEFLCKSYAAEYGLRAMIARPTQTLGAGASADENRVFAQFARSVANNTDIVLHTAGKSSKPYCYTTDAVSALLYILLTGTPGEAYNVANDSTYISIRELAEFIVKNFNPQLKVTVELHPEISYAPDTFLPISTAKIQALGWKPLVGLHEMFARFISYIK